MNHDELFKELLQNFFAEFLTLFFPAEAAQLDLSRVDFLSQETFTDFPEGSLRRADLVAEVSTADGRSELILIHIEVQGARAADVPFRIWEYYHLLRFRHRKPVFPIVLYLSPGAGGIAVERYNEGILGRTFLSFEYAVIGLPDLPASDYERRDNPLAVALAALMRSQEPDRVSRKYRSLLRTAGSNLDEAKKLLLTIIVDRYLPLSLAEAATLAERLEQNPENEAANTMSVYTLIREDALQQGVQMGVEQGVEQGVQQGLMAGVLRGKRDTLLLLMEQKFGPLPPAVAERIEGIETPEELTQLLARVLSAASIDAMGLSD